LTTLKGAVTIAPVVRATVVPKDRTGVRVEHEPFEQSPKLNDVAVRTIIRAKIKFFILKSPRLKSKSSLTHYPTAKIGLEPITGRLTADCSTIELFGTILNNLRISLTTTTLTKYGTLDDTSFPAVWQLW
jgi:hypothetical protein